MNRYLSHAIVFVYLLFQCSLAAAVITQVTATPSAVTANTSTGLNTSIRWQLTLVQEDARSTSGSYYHPRIDADLALVNTPLLVTAPSGTTPQTVSIPETLNLNASQVALWISAGLDQVFYERRFSSRDGSSLIGRVTINLNASSTPPTGTPPAPIPTPQGNNNQGLNKFRTPTAELVIKRLALNFTDLSTVTFVDRGAELKAQLEVTYSGNGTLRGHWQIADPISASGELYFRTLSLVNHALTASQRSIVLSPPLPTQLIGRYYLRFCVVSIGETVLPSTDTTECPTEIFSTVVGYQVFPDKHNMVVLKKLSPNGGSVTQESTFRWPKVPGAVVHQLQIFDVDQFRPTVSSNTSTSNTFVAGMLLPGDTVETSLSHHVIELLTTQHHYGWRMSTYGLNGELLAQSELQGFRFIGTH